MNVSGVLVRARPDRLPGVLTALGEIPGVEVHGVEESHGRVVVTVEDGTDWSAEESLLKVHLLEGISDAALVYQYSDEGEKA